MLLTTRQQLAVVTVVMMEMTVVMTQGTVVTTMTKFVMTEYAYKTCFSLNGVVLFSQFEVTNVMLLLLGLKVLL